MVLNKANQQRKRFSLRHSVDELDRGIFADEGIDFKKVADYFIDKY